MQFPSLIPGKKEESVMSVSYLDLLDRNKVLVSS